MSAAFHRLVPIFLTAMVLAAGCSKPTGSQSGPLAVSLDRREPSEGVPEVQASAAEEGPPCDIHLTDVTDRAGVAFVHDDGGGGDEKYIVEAVSAGVALFDFDGDGLIDIYFLSGAPLPPADQHPRGNSLYRNNGDGTFTNVTNAAGVGDAGFGLGVAVADFDNSGFPDIYLNNFGPNVLYRNNGDGTFTDVTPEAGVGCGDQVGAGAAFLDADGDGAVDLYVSNYVDFGLHNHVRWTIDGFRCYPGPLDFQPVPDVLYRNNGDGTFTDISQSAGIADVAGTGMGMVCGDFNNRGATDIFVANDMHPNLLFENDGTGRFTEVSLNRGAAFNFAGKINGNMGVDCGDFDNDGWLDLFTTSYINEMPVLYRNLGQALFEDATQASGAGAGSLRHVNWGTGFVDFNNNGHRDLFIAQGALDQQNGFRVAQHVVDEHRGRAVRRCVRPLRRRFARRPEQPRRGVRRFDEQRADRRGGAQFTRSADAPLQRYPQRQPLASDPAAGRAFEPRRGRGAGPRHRRRPHAIGRSPQRTRLSEPLRYAAALRPGSR
jgi:hypothetical protein